MISKISWSNYWTVIGVILFIYYVSVVLLYYLQEIESAFAGKTNFIFRNRDKRLERENISAEMGDVVNLFKQELRMILEEAADKKLVKQEVIYALQLLAKKYSDIQETPFRFNITDYILSECSNNCSIHLNGEEVSSLWVK